MNFITPMFQAWKADADEFGIPETQQKGLAFLLALDLTVNPSSEDQDEAIGIIQKLCPEYPDLSMDRIPTWDFGLVTNLLAEIAFQLDPDFSPGVISTLGEGCDIYLYYPQKETRLPDLVEGGYTVANAEKWIMSFARQIGEAIPEGIENAFLDGLHYISTNLAFDQAGTLAAVRMALDLNPPHLLWFKRCLDFPPEELSKGNPVQKTLDCFLTVMPSQEENLMLYKMVSLFSDDLHYQGPGHKNEKIWSANLLTFTAVVSTREIHFSRDSEEPEWIVDLRGKLLEWEFTPPETCSKEDDAWRIVGDEVKKRWGYDLLQAPDDLCPGEQWTRRCCAMFISVVNTILKPGWNAVCFQGR